MIRQASMFNPFGKPIGKVRITDLDKLVANKVPAGWFIDYYENFPDATDLAKSVASLANSEGGWIVIGLAADLESRTAAGVVGFDRAKIHRPNEKVRDLLIKELQRLPYFESKLIKIDDQRAAMVVYVERSDDTPCLTGSGTIYSRSDSGGPVPEKDRYSLTRLFERGHNMRELIEEFSANPFPAAPQDSYLETYLYTLPVNKFRFQGFQHLTFIKKLRKRFAKVADSLPGILDFEHFSTSHGSYILRLSGEPKNYDGAAVTMELFANGNLKLFIPLEGIPIPDTEAELYEIERQYKELSNFKNYLGHRHMDSLKVIDSYKLLVVFTILLEQYLDLLKKSGYFNQVKLRFRLSNVRNTLLFFDTKSYLDYISDYGPPICLKNTLEIPVFVDGNAFEVALDEPPLGFMGLLFGALGLPAAFMPNMLKDLNYYLNGVKIRSDLTARVLGLFED